MLKRLMWRAAYYTYPQAWEMLKRLMWRAAYYTYPQAWEKVMLERKEVNEDAFKHLIVIPPRQVPPLIT